VNETLVRLYELQKIDTELDDLVASRGELPYRVSEMREELSARDQDLGGMKQRVEELTHDLRHLTQENEDLKVKLEKYKAQQYEVKTTREYDAISYQIEDAESRIGRNADIMSRMSVELNNVTEDAESFETELGSVRSDFAESEKALNELIAETAEEETRLNKERKKIAADVTANYLLLYDRIRPAKEGVAVVPVRGIACGGCFNALPRQLVHELKKGDRHSICESCGRIIVGESIAVAVDGEPQVYAYEVDVEEETEE
jgi:predicted  nucleic acid-binding Zn-ribbon protein